MSLNGMIAVVTGAASGIGQASAIRLAQDGADIAVLDINEEGLSETAQEVEKAAQRCLPLKVDLLEREAIAAAFQQIQKDMGRISILHNNAGGSQRSDIRTFAKSDAEQWDYMVTLNLRQVVDCSREVVGSMIEAQYGRIINTSSEMAFRTTPRMTDYSAAKAGMLGFTRSLANEVAAHGVTVNAVCPGATRTALIEKFPEEHRKRTLASIPMGRLGEPEEMAHAVSFFASPLAGYVTGEYLLVTGGRTMH